MLLKEEQQDEVKNQATVNILTLKKVFKTEYNETLSSEFFNFIYENKGAVIKTFLTNYAVIPNIVNGKFNLEKLPYYDELDLELYNLVSPLYTDFIRNLRK